MITRADYKDFPDTMVEFLNYMDAIKNRSKNTVSEYATDLRTFFRYIKCLRGMTDVDPSDDEEFQKISIKDCDDEFVKKITITDAYSFLSFCKDTRGNSARTRARKVSTLRDFFKFCKSQKGIIKEDPMQNLDSPKLRQSLPKYLTLEEATDLLRSSFEGPHKERDFAIITLFLNCGMRLSELVGLNYTDIRDDNTIKV
ncbi:MAG: recombinase XerC, partial [Clostridia bacterium]|nr:recombinase XerC [Clostridia bacterium]